MALQTVLNLVSTRSCIHAVLHGLEPLASEPTIFRSKNRRLACLAFEIYLHARKIKAFTIFAVADNVKNNETRGSVFLKYSEGDEFCNILMPNDTF